MSTGTGQSMSKVNIIFRLNFKQIDKPESYFHVQVLNTLKSHPNLYR